MNQSPDPIRTFSRYLPLLLLALLFSMLITACTQPPAAATLTPPALHTSTPLLPHTPTPPSSTLSIPHWLTFNYPGDWFRIIGRAPGFAGVASRDIGILPSNNLTGDSAVFYIFQGQYEASDPLVAMREERLGRLSEDIEILSPPAAAAVNGLPGAKLRYRFTLNDGAPGIVRLSLVRTPDGRYAEVWAISREDDAQRYAPIFDQIESTLTLNDLHPAPTIEPSAPTPATFISYTFLDDTFTLSLPPSWEAIEADFGLLLHPTDTPSIAQLVTGPVPEPQPEATATELMQTIAQNLLPELIYDAVPISPIAITEDDTHTHARAYYAGTDQGQPVFILLGVVIRDQQQLYAIAMLPTPTGEAPPVLDTVEAILNTITIDRS